MFVRISRRNWGLGLLRFSRSSVLKYRKHFMSANAREGGSMVNRSMLRAEAPDAISKVVDYFRQDYACLGYEPPAGR